MTIRFGVIGAGRIGKVHARTVARNPKARLAYIADALPRAAQALAELNAFIDAVEAGDRAPRPNGFDGLQAQILADAATESWQTGKPVKVSR
jgi:predicted dehydrogenase